MSEYVLSIIARGRDEASGVLGNVAGALTNVGKVATGALAVIGAGFGATTTAATTFEQSFTGVRKTVDMAESEMQALAAGLLDMASATGSATASLPDAANELAHIAELAGQLGVRGTDNILKFTEVIAGIGISTNLTTEEAAQAFARFGNIMNMPMTQVDRLGATVVALGNNLATTEQDITNMALRLAGAGNVIGLTEAQVLGLAGAMSSVGIEAEMGGSAMSRVMVEIANAVASGGDALTAFAGTAGLSAADFAAAFRDDPAAAIVAFVSGLADIQAAGGNVFATLDELGLGEIRVRDALLRLAGAGDLMTTSLGIANTAWTENTALLNEAARFAETTAAAKQQLKNELAGVAITVGTALLPVVGTLVNVLGDLTDRVAPVVIAMAQRFAEWFGALPEPIQQVVAVAGALATGLSALGTAGSLLSPILGGLGSSIAGIAGPIGIVVAAVGALAVAWETNFLGMRDALQPIVDDLITWFRDELPGALQTMRATFQTVWAAVRTAVDDALTFVQGIVERVSTQTAGTWEATWFRVQNIVETVTASVRSIIHTVFGALELWLARHGADIQQFMAEAWNSISRIINMAVQVIEAIIVPVFTGIASFLRTHGTGIQRFMDNTWTMIKTIITTALGVIEGVIATVLAVIRGDWQGAWEAVKKVADTLWQGIITLITTALEQILLVIGTDLETVKAKFVAALNAVVQTVTGFASTLADAGRALIQGLIDGIESMAGALVAKARGVVDGAIQAAKNLLGIHSPSTVFAEIGRDTIEGLIKGFDEKKVAAAKAIAEGVSSIIKAAVDAAAALREFQPVDNLGVITDQIMDFLLGVETQFEGLVAQVDQKLAAKAAELAEAVKPVVELVGGAVETLQKLAEYQDLHGLTPAIENMVYWLRRVTLYMGWNAQTVAGELQEAARSWAENAKPVVELVGGAVETLQKLAEYQDLHGLTPAIENMVYWLRQVTQHVGAAGLLISEELQTAAKVFADNAGPVVGVIGDGLASLTQLAEIVALPDLAMIDPALNQLRDFLGRLVVQLSIAGQLISDELQETARTFAENAGPVVGVIEDAVKAFLALANWTDLARSEDGMRELPGFIRGMVESMGQAGRLIGQDLQQVALEFSGNATQVMKVVLDSVKALSEFAILQAKLGNPKKALLPATDLLDAGIMFIETMVIRISEMRSALSVAVLADARFIADMVSTPMKMLIDAIKALAEISTIDLSDLSPIGFTAGLDWITSLADGIRSGMSYLEAALREVADMFPHSPAKAGPLRELPDWSAWMLAGLDGAANQVGAQLAGVQVGGQVSRWANRAGSAEPATVQVTINHPVVRDEVDIRRLADEVGKVFTGQALTYRRLATA